MTSEAGNENQDGGGNGNGAVSTERQRIRCAYCNKLNTVFSSEDEDTSKNNKSEKVKKAVCKKCRLPLATRSHKKWSFVNPDSYIHPLDRQALQTLRAIPGIDAILKKLIAITSERMYRVACKANSVRVTDEQYPRLDAMLDVVCETLNLPKPELYVSVTNDFGGLSINAMTSGADQPFIILYSGLVERLSDEEVMAVLAHEMGHIHCQHLLYRTAAVALLFLLYISMSMTPFGGILNTISQPVKYALLIWMHKSELSCDRTALLVTQNARVVMSALTKLAGGNLNDELNLDAFINQAREFDKAFDEDFLDKFWTLVLASRSSHPFPVWRVSEILKWTEDDSPLGYHQLVAQDGRIDIPGRSKD